MLGASECHYEEEGPPEDKTSLGESKAEMERGRGREGEGDRETALVTLD